MELQVGEHFRLRRKLGSGSFGEVFSGRNTETGEQVAIKLEMGSSKHQLLAHEAHMYKALQGLMGIPRMHWHGVESDYNVLVIDRLGPSLQNLFEACERKFSLKTVLMLAEQMITRVEQMHAKDYLHRDIKPDNFLIGGHQAGKAGLVHVIDFGLAKRYRDKKTQAHMPFREGKSLIGTARFASVNTHRGVEQSRRDDMEAIGYVLVYFLRGNLPWQGLKVEDKKEMHAQILKMKTAMPTQKLCENQPSEFATYLDYVKGLSFTEKPDYEYLKDLFRDLLLREGSHNDFAFDWIVPSSASTVRSSRPIKQIEEEGLQAAAVAAC